MALWDLLVRFMHEMQHCGILPAGLFLPDPLSFARARGVKLSIVVRNKDAPAHFWSPAPARDWMRPPLKPRGSSSNCVSRDPLRMPPWLEEALAARAKAARDREQAGCPVTSADAGAIRSRKETQSEPRIPDVQVAPQVAPSVPVGIHTHRSSLEGCPAEGKSCAVEQHVQMENLQQQHQPQEQQPQQMQPQTPKREQRGGQQRQTDWQQPPQRESQHDEEQHHQQEQRPELQVTPQGPETDRRRRLAAWLRTAREILDPQDYSMMRQSFVQLHGLEASSVSYEKAKTTLAMLVERLAQAQFEDGDALCAWLLTLEDALPVGSLREHWRFLCNLRHASALEEAAPPQAHAAQPGSKTGAAASRAVVSPDEPRRPETLQPVPPQLVDVQSKGPTLAAHAHARGWLLERSALFLNRVTVPAEIEAQPEQAAKTSGTTGVDDRAAIAVSSASHILLEAETSRIEPPTCSQLPPPTGLFPPGGLAQDAAGIQAEHGRCSPVACDTARGSPAKAACRRRLPWARSDLQQADLDVSLVPGAPSGERSQAEQSRTACNAMAASERLSPRRKVRKIVRSAGLCMAR
eukprot:TRINITY_DN11084_c0_g1_i1.p1 TRINITY_DN11084_c0_g1~~TRINITY_DN11084_c0_g1_i1.p1  ORF type:complete len:578 (-),score=89.06 TRINITY_DN11084_c0_g1_i1:175-1908(-)